MKVLITGGTGSLGSKLIPHFLKKGEVRVLSRDEDKQSRMKREFPVEFILGDIRNKDDCLRAVNGCNVVIHAAALKRIEFGEEFPFQFIKTNLLGTINMVEAAKKEKVDKFIFISTDKAVEAVNAYGMTKALAEKIVVNAKYNCVRYGNVNNSRGSVLPYWKSCKEKGLPITVTNPFMTRFLIDFSQAIELIDIALEGKMNGDIYIPKLDAACLGDMAKIMAESPPYADHEAHKEVLRALKSHKLEKKNICNRCEKKGKTIFHHSDYNKPLFVEEICYSCHQQIHKTRGVYNPNYGKKYDKTTRTYISQSLSPKVVFSNERPGEKLREVLINEDEYRNRTEDKGSHFIIHRELRPNLFKMQTNDKGIRMEYSSETTKLLKGKKLKDRLREFI